MQLTKMHRVLQYRQTAWLKEYIDFNTTQRAQAKNDFEKDFFKLMNNAVFGKTMENVRNRIDYKLVTSGSNDQNNQLIKLSAKCNYKCHKIFNEHVVGVEMSKTKVNLNKPIIIGFSILEMSKVLMYGFHYDTIVPTYGSKAKLMFTDTDSLLYHIETPDVYADMRKINNLMDFSDYPKDHANYDVSNKKVIGKFKDECNGASMSEFVGLKSKMYSFTTESKNVKKAKGIKTSCIKQDITHEDYKRCILEDSYVMHSKMNAIRSFKHTINSIKINKISLSSYDDKRYYTDAVTSLAYGHYKIGTK
jgi:hypothetical protein